MNSFDRAFIKVYAEHDNSSSEPNGESQVQPDQSEETQTLQLAQGTVVVGTWNGRGDPAAEDG